MVVVLPKSLDALLALQHDVVTTAQALERGTSKPEIARLVRVGHWQRLYRGVYFVYNSPVPRRSQLHGALLGVGHGAVLSHETAAEVWRIADRPSPSIHVSVPRKTGPVTRAEGVTVHYSARLPAGECRGAIGLGMPPVIAAEEVIYDLAQVAVTAEEAVNWAIRACQRKCTTPDLISMYMLEPGHRDWRWREDLRDALTEIRAGVESPLERRYLHDVERAHGLPSGRRQVKAKRGTSVQYQDVRYADFGVAVELDGVRYHRADARSRDDLRDNSNTLEGLLTLRYGWNHVAYHPCEVAWEVWTLLAQRGHAGDFRRCPRCPALSASRPPLPSRPAHRGA